MAPEDAGHVKGVLLVHLREFVSENHGKGVWEKLAAGFDARDTATWRGLILASSWYSVGTWNRGFQSILNSRPDAKSELRRIAHFVSERDMSTVFRMLLRIAPPESIITRVGSLWARYFDVGTLTPTKLAAQRWKATLEAPLGEDSGPGELTCMGVCGWIERALDQTGTSTSRIIQTHCRFRGAPRCEYEITW